MRINSPARHLGLTLAVMGFAMSSAGCAEGPRRAGGPPPVAIDACLDKSAQEACHFTDGARSILGTCQERGDDWVCVPDREPPPRGGSVSARPDAGGPASVGGGAAVASGAGAEPLGRTPPKPPREAFDACLGLRVGAACSVGTPQGEIDGRCDYSGDLLACIPSDPNHRPAGLPDRR